MLRYLALFALLLITPAAAQDHFFPTPGNAIVPGYVTMCIVANQAVPCAAGGSVVAGTTTTSGCAAGGILWNNAGTIACGAQGVLAANGVFSLGTSASTGFVGTSSTNVLLSDSTNASTGGAAVTSAGFSSRVSYQYGWSAGNPGANDTTLCRQAAGVVEIGSGGACAANGTLLVGPIQATLPTATGTNVVCNTPGTNTALSVQVSATGCAASSARFKEGIASLDKDQALSDVLRFQPVSYVYKPKDRNPCDCDMGSDKHVGFTAEQIGSVDPQWITYEKDGVTPYAVKSMEMAPLFAAAIQALKADNDNLRAELDAIKRMVGAR